MSGRDREPIAAFFPSIDRNLIRDLDRHLRNAAPTPEPEALPAAAPEPEAPIPTRPNTSDILEAVDHAAASIAAMQARIHELETKQHELESTNTQLRAKLGELLQSQQALEALSRAEREKAQHAEQIAAQHLSRAQLLENDLAAALNDLNRISVAITGALANVVE